MTPREKALVREIELAIQSLESMYEGRLTIKDVCGRLKHTLALVNYEMPLLALGEEPPELVEAEKRCPEVGFVRSCRAFFNKNGFLSEKQRNALRYSGTPFRKARYAAAEDPLSEDPDPLDEPAYTGFPDDEIPY